MSPFYRTQPPPRASRTCDRCGAEIDCGDSFAGLFYVMSDAWSPITKDLCKECAASLREWLENEQDGWEDKPVAGFRVQEKLHGNRGDR